MEDNLLVGDHLLVNKFAFGARGSFCDAVLPFKQIHRGDVIVFKYPKDLTKHYVKRAIGLPGDHVKIVDKQVFVNGVPLDEPYKIHKSSAGFLRRSVSGLLSSEAPSGPALSGHRTRTRTGTKTLYKDGEIVVPPGHYFAMGDNRDNSADSRYWGFVPRELIVGKGTDHLLVL